MWDTLEADQGEGLSFLFVDNQGTKMQAFVEQANQMNRFKRCLHEGECKILTGFSVIMVDTEFRLTEARKKIALTSNTEVTPAADFDVFVHLDILPYEYVLDYSSNVQSSFTRDFLGFIYEVKITKLTEDDSIPRNTLNDAPKITNSIDFTLQDNEYILFMSEVKKESLFEFNPIGIDEVDYFTDIMCSSDQDSEEVEEQEMEFDYFNGCKSDNKK
ncbi:unnamed protein product [Microthlaspi erraticum]|uniref:Replication protein A 70 kDa DNA-binding subunit B/D first OB fold domain-containing protein n=1 Tax=Microthlaspi erraticum TaxID=1685480 RepID=A0A6D2KXN8_9BRAS|nr:unnamed protein product [Microthlaspi erraticum]